MHDDLTHKLASLGQAIRHAPDDREAERTLTVIQRRHVRRRVARQVTTSAALVALLLGVAWLAWPAGGPEDPPVVAAHGEVIRFGDATHVTPLTDTTRVAEVLAEETEALRLTLSQGRARFEVDPKRRRRVEVVAGHVRVTVVGTVFVVERHPARGSTGDAGSTPAETGERVRVEVTRGEVQVRWPGGDRRLSAGQEAWFEAASPQRAETNPTPEETTAPSTEDNAAQDADSALQNNDTVQEDGANPATDPPQDTQQGDARPTPAERAEPAREAHARAGRWRTLARAKKYKEAFAVLQKAPAGAVRDAPGELLLAADVARLSGHPVRAVPHLKRLLQRHPGDGRAAMAAFTLGRLYLNNLGKPAQAAQMFARVGALPGAGPLAENALAREVQAWSRAGNAARARAAAKRYLARFPNGARAAMVRQHAGLDAPPK